MAERERPASKGLVFHPVRFSPSYDSVVISSWWLCWHPGQKMNFSLRTWLTPFIGCNSVKKKKCRSQDCSCIGLWFLDFLEAPCWTQVPLLTACLVFSVGPVKRDGPPVLLIQLKLKTATATTAFAGIQNLCRMQNMYIKEQLRLDQKMELDINLISYTWSGFKVCEIHLAHRNI